MVSFVRRSQPRSRELHLYILVLITRNELRRTAIILLAAGALLHGPADPGKQDDQHEQQRGHDVHQHGQLRVGDSRHLHRREQHAEVELLSRIARHNLAPVAAIVVRLDVRYRQVRADDLSFLPVER